MCLSASLWPLHHWVLKAARKPCSFRKFFSFSLKKVLNIYYTHFLENIKKEKEKNTSPTISPPKGSRDGPVFMPFLPRQKTALCKGLCFSWLFTVIFTTQSNFTSCSFHGTRQQTRPPAFVPSTSRSAALRPRNDSYSSGSTLAQATPLRPGVEDTNFHSELFF